ncbi:MAG: thiamine pyrophosphate-binding protein [Elusimicrobia bacterium]|nr:thiamine pyrophosphate-binding protein [Elusimicrobiota bacterium]
MKLTDYVAEFLSKEVKHVFVGNGGVVVHLLDSIDRHPGVKIIPCENEQGAAIAAEAYSRVSGNLGVAIATSGPGVINLLQGIACAYYNSIPVLFIAGAPPVDHLRGNRSVRQLGFQEMDVVKITETFTKYAVLVIDAKRIRYELEKLVYMAKEGRPGPVILDLPDDLQRVDIDPDKLESFVPEKTLDNTDYWKAIGRLREMIKAAERPLIIVGGGVKISKTEVLMKSLLRKWGIPFAATWAAKDIFLEDDPDLVGNFGISSSRYGNFAVQTADLIVSFGSRMDTHETGGKPSTFAPKAKKIMIDIDAGELDKNNGVDLDLAVHADLRMFLKKLESAAIETGDISKWKARIQQWRKRYPVCDPEYYKREESVNPYVFMTELSKVTGTGDIIITDAGGTLIWTMQAYQILRPQLLFSAFNHSPMGYALPASIGAQFAAPDKQVVCITGDGGLNMNIQELETVLFNKLPIKIFVINNGEYGIMKQTQATWLESRFVASDSSSLGFPDLVKIAQAYGYETVEIKDHRKMAGKIRRVLASKKPVFCSIKLKNNEPLLPKLVFGKPLEDLAPLLDREELKRNLKF